jgi:hypothetical protein
MPDLSDLVVTWNAKPQHAHFAILMARCPTLLANLNSKDTKISHDMFRQFLSYVYEDHLVSTVLRDIESALQMLALATKFGVHSLAAGPERLLCIFSRCGVLTYALLSIARRMFGDIRHYGRFKTK